MKVRLNVVAGPAKGRFFDIDENQTLVIGRGEQSDTRINDPSVSRVHCEVTVCEEQITIVDKGSSSGTKNAAGPRKAPSFNWPEREVGGRKTGWLPRTTNSLRLEPGIQIVEFSDFQ